MGGVVSSGQNNDDLIDNLLEADYIKSSLIERVFRAVDRAEYYLPEARTNAYKDLAWKHSNLHISAPCIYSEVMEGLCLEPGLSFLNLGSGTGYLSTMVGLVLGSYGINHGIEYYSDVVQYANKKLEDFKNFSGAIDEFDYCEPKFMQGNCLCLSSDFHAQYDRVYCGAACPEEFESYMINLLKIGGILVMPLNDQLLQIKRTSETNWSVKPLLPVSFASLIQPPQNTQDLVQMFDVETPNLQSLCRSVIRNILRKNVELEHPPVKRKIPGQKGPKKKRVLRRLVVPLFESEDSSDDDRHVRLGGSRNRDAGRAVLNFVMGIVRDGSSQQNSDNRTSDNRDTEQSTSEENKMETDTTEEEISEKKSSSTHQETRMETKAVIEHNPSTSRDEGGSSYDKSDVEIKADDPEGTINPVGNNNNGQSANPEESSEMQEEAHCSMTDIQSVIVDVLDVLRRERGEGDALELNDDQADNEDEREEVTENRTADEVPENKPSASDATKNKNEGQKKREKFDSGLGDEIVETQSASSDDDTDMKLGRLGLNSGVDVASSSDDDHREKRPKRLQPSARESRCAFKWRRIESGIQRFVADSSSENDNEEPKVDNEMRMYESPCTEHMRAKIQQLPLPTILKRYINFFREF